MYDKATHDLRLRRMELNNTLNCEGKFEDVLRLSEKHFDIRQRLLKLAEETAECAAAIARVFVAGNTHFVLTPEFKNMVEEIVDCHIVTTDVLVNHILVSNPGLFDLMVTTKLDKFKQALDKLERASSGEN
jgi:hypothetical protein